MKFLVVIVALSVEFAWGQSLGPLVPNLSKEAPPIVPQVSRPVPSPIEAVIKDSTPLPLEVPREGNLPEPIIKVRPSSSEDLREASLGTVMVGYQWITSWLPSKKTLSYTHIFSRNWTLEGEYSSQTIDTTFIGVDLGEISERRTTLHARRYFGNSFHLSFGAVFSTFKARLGGDFVDNLGNPIRSSFRAENLGLSGGLGSRWQWDNGLTLGVDWIRLNLPVLETQVNDNVLDTVDGRGKREDVKDVIRTFNRIPTFVLLGLNLGYTF